MALRFTVLASGSGGNSSFIQAGDFGLLLDIGLGPRQLASRLTAAGTTWHDVHAVLLTHTHTDHWNDRTLAQLHKRGIPFYCHPGHLQMLRTEAPSCAPLEQAGLMRTYEDKQEATLAPGLRYRPFAICHDGGPTFGFRIEATADLFGRCHALAYAADLGCWDAATVAAISEVDLLALEFNHDVQLEYASGRSPHLVNRVLGEEGHLSNDQAAELVRAVIKRSTPGRLRHLVQLHLSRECNRPRLAAETARGMLADLGAAVEVHTASQDRNSPTIEVGMVATAPRRSSPTRQRHKGALAAHPIFPGMDDS